MFSRLFSVRTNDIDIAERGRLLKGAALLIGLAAVSVLWLTLVKWQIPLWTIVNISVVIISGVVFALAHYGYTKTGGTLLTAALMAAVTFSSVLNMENAEFLNVAPFIIPLLIGGLVLGSSGVMFFGPIAFVLILMSAWMRNSLWSSANTGPYIIIALTVGLVWLMMRTLEAAAASARRQTEASLAAQRELEHQQAAVQAKNEELTNANTQMTALLDLVRDLETPVIPLLDDVLLLPLVGHMDTRRAAQLNETVLETVHAQRAKLLIIDITGLSVVDTAVAQRLVHLAHGVKLLGARVLLTGIRAEIAQTIVAQGMDLSAIQTAGRLQDSIATVLRNSLTASDATTYAR